MWMRGVEVIVTRADDPSKQVLFSKHRIDFEVRNTIGWSTDTANITLFNLSIEEIKFLQNKNYGELFIEIRAGYLDQLQDTGVIQRKVMDGQVTSAIRIGGTQTLPTLFSGIITNAVGYRRPPEHITQLFCISKAYSDSTTFKQMRNIPKGSTLRDAIESMCADYGYQTIATYGVDGRTLDRVLPNGRVFHDTFLIELQNLLHEYNLQFSLTTGEIQVFPDTYADKDALVRMSKDREPIRLDVNSVIGNPVAGINTYQLKTFLNPSIQPGMIMDVTPLLGEEILVNGVTSISGGNRVLNDDQSIFRYAMEDKYFIKESAHFGSTHGMEFQTLVLMELGGNSMMGSKENNWVDMYASTGMAMEPF